MVLIALSLSGPRSVEAGFLKHIDNLACHRIDDQDLVFELDVDVVLQWLDAINQRPRQWVQFQSVGNFGA